MAAVEVTISGVLYDKLSRTTRPCVLIGEASLTGLEIGGGPSGGGNGPPLHIWGPSDPRPSNPISGIPGLPGYFPPIPTEPPPSGGDKPPPESGGWGFVSEWAQWGYFPGPTGAQPK